jgi:hypothetical protein
MKVYVGYEEFIQTFVTFLLLFHHTILDINRGFSLVSRYLISVELLAREHQVIRVFIKPNRKVLDVSTK